MRRLIAAILLHHVVEVFSWTGRGADLTYRFADSNRIVIEASVYKDCTDAVPGPDDLAFGVFAGNSKAECGSVNLDGFELHSIQQVRDGCNQADEWCGTGSNFPHVSRLEMYKYRCTLSLKSEPLRKLLQSNCEWLVFYVKAGTRPFWLTTMTGSTDLYVMAGLHMKNIRRFGSGVVNNSPVWLSAPQTHLLLNTKNHLNAYAIDTADIDFVTINFTPAKVSQTGAANSYQSPFTFTFPLTPYCITPGDLDCSPRPYARTPLGIFLDSINGNLILTPTDANQRGSMVFEAREKRMHYSGIWLDVGFVTREVVFTVPFTGFNNTPVLTSPAFNQKVAAGDLIKAELKVEDILLSPYQNRFDSLSLTMLNYPAESTWQWLKDTVNKKNLEFTWQTDTSDSRLFPYHFLFTVSDHHCPFPGIINAAVSYQVGNGRYNNLNTATLKPAAENLNFLRLDHDLVILNSNVRLNGLKIFDINGRLIKEQNTNSGIRTTQFISGYYVCVFDYNIESNKCIDRRIVFIP